MDGDSDHPANAIIDAFGGIRPMATKLGVPVSTVQGWKQRDSIPAGRMGAVREAAAAAGITLPEPGAEFEPPVIEHEPTDAEASSAPHDRAAPRRGGGIAVLALLISLAAAGWVWWTTAGPGAGDGENVRISALEGRVARLADAPASVADPEADPGKQARAALSRELEALRAQVLDIAPPDLETLVAPLREQLARLQAETKRLEQAGGSGAAAPADEQLQALEKEIQNAVQLASTNMQAMSGVVLEFETKLNALAERLGKLAPRLDALEAVQGHDTALANQSVSLALAATQLRQALGSGQTFRDTLDLVETIAGTDDVLADALKTLGRSADTGVATLPVLQAAFAELVPAVLASQEETGNGDILDQLATRAREIVRIRRTGADVPGDTTEARIARAEFLLARGDVAASVAALAPLDAEAAAVIAPWVERAQAHLDARSALATIETRALQRLRGESDPG